MPPDFSLHKAPAYDLLIGAIFWCINKLYYTDPSQYGSSSLYNFEDMGGSLPAHLQLVPGGMADNADGEPGRCSPR
jgi:hypothetical protein